MPSGYSNPVCFYIEHKYKTPTGGAKRNKKKAKASKKSRRLNRK